MPECPLALTDIIPFGNRDLGAALPGVVPGLRPIHTCVPCDSCSGSSHVAPGPAAMRGDRRSLLNREVFRDSSQPAEPDDGSRD